MCWISRKPRLATIAKYALSDAGLGKLSLTFPDDHEMLQHGMVVHDAFYAACPGTPLKNAAAWRV